MASTGSSAMSPQVKPLRATKRRKTKTQKGKK